MDETQAFELLKLEKTASIEEAKKAYRARAKENHPDWFARDDASADGAEKRMQRINSAYKIVSTALASARKREIPVSQAPSSSGEPPFSRGQKTEEIREFFRTLVRKIINPGKTGTRQKTSPRKKREQVFAKKKDGVDFEFILKRSMAGRSSSRSWGRPRPAGRDGRPEGRPGSCRGYDRSRFGKPPTKKFMDKDIGPIEPVRPVSRVRRIGGR